MRAKINWTTVIAAYAALVSTGVGVVALLDFFRSESRHVTVRLTVVGRTADQGKIEVRAVNDGNRRVTIHHVGLQHRDAALGDPYVGIGEVARVSLPKALDEGEQLVFSIDAKRLFRLGDWAGWLMVLTAENARFRAYLANALRLLREPGAREPPAAGEGSMQRGRAGPLARDGAARVTDG